MCETKPNYFIRRRVQTTQPSPLHLKEPAKCLTSRTDACLGRLQAVLDYTEEKSMQEIWKAIEGFEGLYEVSNHGNVRSLDRIVHHSREFTREQKGNLLKPQPDKENYLTVSLYINGKPHRYKVHRLVALAFLENTNNHKEVNHKDEDKQNNRADNLEWCDRKYNENYGTKRQRQLEHTDFKARGAKLTKAVLQLSETGEVIRRWKSLTEIKATMGYSMGNISMACNGKYTKPLYGYRWRWDNEQTLRQGLL